MVARHPQNEGYAWGDPLGVYSGNRPDRFNLCIRIVYSSFYSQAEEEFAISRLNNGFICQDLDYLDRGGGLLAVQRVCASGDSISPLYRRDANDVAVEFLAELPDGSSYLRRGVSITISPAYAFLTCNESHLISYASKQKREGAYAPSLRNLPSVSWLDRLSA